MSEQDKKLEAEKLRLKQEQLNVDKQILAILARRSGLSEDEIRLQREYANVLQEQAKHLDFSVNQKRRIKSISKSLNDLAEKAYTFDVRSLGITTKASKIEKQIEDSQQKQRLLSLQKRNVSKDIAALQEKQAKSAKGLSDQELKNLQDKINYQVNLNSTIDSQVALSSRVTQELQRQAEAANEIENNKIANSFGVMGNVLGKIPLLSNFAPGFKDAEAAARSAGAEVTLFSKGMMDASDYTMKNMDKMGPDARVVSTMDADKVAKLEQAAAKAQAKLDKGGLKKGEAEKLQKVVQKGGDAEVGKETTLYGAAAKTALEAGTGDLKGVNKQLLEMKAGFAAIANEVGKLVLLALVKAMFDANQQMTDIRRNIEVSGVEAFKLHVQFQGIAAMTGDARVNLKSLFAASSALNSSYGTALMFNEETLKTSAKLIDAKVLEGEAVANLSMQSRINGQTIEQSIKSQEKAVNSVNKENKTRISLRGVMKESAKVNGQIAAQLQGNPEAIGRAVTQAKALGMELNEVAAAGKQMLDFESSIENELTAELMLGKQLNLEKARLAALTGDYETLTQEINKNVGDFGDFTQMNVLQQDALAASVGMTSDQLSNQLMKKANLEELAKEALARGDKQQYLDLTALSTQEKMEKLVLKVQDAFIGVATALQPITWALGFILDILSTLPGQILVVVGAISLMVKAAKAFKVMETLGAVASIFKGAFSKGGHPLAALTIALGSVGAMMVAFNKVQSAGDVMSPADGKTQISTKEGGLFELSKNDDVAAGPGILDKLKSKAMGLVGGLTGGGGIESLANAFNNLISIVTSKFDLLIQTITEKQGEGNNLQKSTSENLTNNLSTLAATQNKNESIHKKLAMGMVAASMGIFGIGATTAISSDVISDTNTIKPGQEETISKPAENEKTIAVLESKLEDIRKLLAQKQNMNLNVKSTMKYDSFAENNASYSGGKQSQEAVNSSDFI
tara:strand:+ start:4939 stop:7845 length:2907 start_codon:yes stop_codon:yes gene_type:complete